MTSSLESFEEKFRKVEQASERRVLDEPRLSQISELVDPVTEPRRHYKGPGVSQADEGLRSLAPSPLFSAASKSAFYHAMANPRSVESFVSASLEKVTQHTEEQHETQVERIAGRQTLPRTMGALLPRRLTRTQSQLGYLSINRSTVVDVSVETTTEWSQLSSNLQTSTAYATRPSRPRAATMNIVRSGNLVERAKDFVCKLRRKSRGEDP
ncbi:hypothetical protein J3R82DRAFT_1404 [Butyriboletus roseoflavus]|nr:hypothetical protein J3R82DRAFT_1404 [Butyriboletus roseoflavus]